MDAGITLRRSAMSLERISPEWMGRAAPGLPKGFLPERRIAAQEGTPSPLAQTPSLSGAPRLALRPSGKNATHPFGGNPL